MGLHKGVLAALAAVRWGSIGNVAPFTSPSRTAFVAAATTPCRTGRQGSPAVTAGHGDHGRELGTTAAGAAEQFKGMKLLVANRGEIAARILNTARRLGVPTVLVYSDADADGLAVGLADEAYNIGPPAARDSYLRGDAILDVARRASATALHPGYGFLSENAAFAERCMEMGIKFVGPSPAAMTAMGDKSAAKAIMSKAGVPIVPGYFGDDQTMERIAAEAEAIGYPLLVKACLGGGGKGMKLARTATDLTGAITSARREALAAFGDERILVERFVQQPRHIEVQVLADAHGGCVHLHERDCSVQRRHQKIIEEAPGPSVSPEFRARLGAAAVDAASAVGYEGAGTVEFIVDTVTGDFYFMEMNTRLQVEHPVTEAITGIDLVEWQLRVAAGEHLPFDQAGVAPPIGHAVEARVYAENVPAGFLPAAGTVLIWEPPAGASAFADAPVRVDAAIQNGDQVGLHYDPMIAKVIAKGPTRTDALNCLGEALQEVRLAGVPNNLLYLQRVLDHPAFRSGRFDTSFTAKHEAALLAPVPLDQELTALSAVAKLLLEGASACASGTGDAESAGPWGARDGKVLYPALAVRDEHVFDVPAAHCRVTASVAYVAHDTFDVDLSVEPLAQDGMRRDEDGAPEVSVKKGTTGLFAAPIRISRTSLSPSGTLSAELLGRRLSAEVVSYSYPPGRPTSVVLDVWVEGRSQEISWPMKAWSRKEEDCGPGEAPVHAPMPGRIVGVPVKEGDIVAAGQTVAVLEAMKMEHTLTAAKAGVVGSLRVGAGSQVQDGQVLAVIQDAPKEQGAGDAEQSSEMSVTA